MADYGDARPANTLSRISLRNIVLKSSLARFQEKRLNFAHLNLGSDAQYIGELNDLLKEVDMQISINMLVLMVSGLLVQTGVEDGVWWWRRLILEGKFELQGSCAVVTSYYS
jgi:hypothetical protein